MDGVNLCQVGLHGLPYQQMDVDIWQSDVPAFGDVASALWLVGDKTGVAYYGPALVIVRSCGWSL